MREHTAPAADAGRGSTAAKRLFQIGGPAGSLAAHARYSTKATPSSPVSPHEVVVGARRHGIAAVLLPSTPSIGATARAELDEILNLHTESVAGRSTASSATSVRERSALVGHPGTQSRWDVVPWCHR
jgi:hypothetical protein